MRLRVAVSLPRDGETVSLIRGVVRHALTTFGVTTECVDEIQLGLSEACTNVIEHAAADDAYEVGFEVDAQRCTIRVINTGAGFDAGDLVNAMPDPSSPRGRGVAIMRAVMDRVEFTSTPEAGTIVRLVKTLTLNPGAPLTRLR